jgi:VanZ family protein
MAGIGKANLWLVIFLGLLGCILFLAVAPNDATPVGSWHLPDKAEHVTAFLALGSTLRPATPTLSFSKQLLGLMAVAAGVEIIQAATPFARVADILDFVASSAGAVGGLALAAMIEARLQPTTR